MPVMERDTSRNLRHRLFGATSRLACKGALAASAFLGLGGCAALDDFSFKNLSAFSLDDFRDPPDPLNVVRNSKDGRLRSRALRCLPEPLANGGTKEDQDVVVAVLNYTASNDSQALCRMAAIDMLRKYKDPRAADGLKEAYYRAGSFNPDVATVLRCQALQAMGETGQAAVVDTLIRVLREPPVEGPDQDRQLKLDERIAAARALSYFKQYQATEALLDVMRKERDVALRACAHESLVEITGRHLPQDPALWAEFIANPNSKEVLARELSWTDRLIQLTGLK
jgi:HEAT repeat protein